jgi:hypothetical protein
MCATLGDVGSGHGVFLEPLLGPLCGGAGGSYAQRRADCNSGLA